MSDQPHHAPHRLRVNALERADGIDDPTPQFSWRPARGDDAIHHVEVHTGGQHLWTSPAIGTDSTPSVRYDGPPLQARSTYTWHVIATVERSQVASERHTFETGQLSAQDWSAAWVSSRCAREDDGALYLRGLADLPAPVVTARAYVSALGWYRFLVNGVDQSGPALVPRWTPFDQVVEYQTYDVTDHLREGVNILAMVIGDGRYRGHLGFRDQRGIYGDKLAGIVEVHAVLADGSHHVLRTDHTWTAGSGRITASDPKRGDRTDLRIDEDDWLHDSTTPARFTPAELLPPHPRRLIAEETARVTEVARLPAQRVWRSPTGHQLVDFGQNAAGVVNIRLRGNRGTRVTLTHSEVLTTSGELDLHYVHARGEMTWTQSDEVILDGTDVTYQPSFTIHGFRYVQVDGLAYDLDAADIDMVVLSSDLQAAGTFTCSDPRVTRLWQNVLWSTRSNFVDTPTDCPTRERSGWTGDIQVFAPTATGMFDVHAYLRRYLRNLALEQLDDGRVPPFIPTEASQQSTGRLTWALGKTLANATGWGDAAVLVPWVLYEAYADERILADQYDSMRAWVNYQADRARTRRGFSRLLSRHRIGTREKYIVDSGFHWGEWLRPGEHFPANALEGTLNGAVVATAYLAHSAATLARAAHVLGRSDDAAYYRVLAHEVRTAWREAFIRDRGARIGTDRQDDYVRALAFGLVPTSQVPAAVSRLVELIDAAGTHLQTGFLSTPMLLEVLTRHGHVDLAYALLLQDSAPSWLRQVDLGATTIWETWEGHDSDGNPTQSHNHYAFGAVAAWLRERVLGIKPTAPGHRAFIVEPHLGGGLTFANGTLETVYGTIAVDWTVDAGNGDLRVTVPYGTTCTIVTPDGRAEDVGPGTHQVTWQMPRPAQQDLS